jgi:hypothetical protein
MATLTRTVNGRAQTVDVDPTTPLLSVRSDDLTLRGPVLVRGNRACAMGHWAPCHRGSGESACDEAPHHHGSACEKRHDKRR